MVHKMSVSDLYAKLEEKVAGQEEAKKSLAYAGFMHRVRSLHSFTHNKILRKTNILLLGPTGCGKTYLCKTLADELNMPFHEINALDITKQGYAGTSIEEHISAYVSANRSRYDRHEIKHGVILIDEIDKVCGPMGTKDGGDFNQATQDSILKCIEGTTMEVGKYETLDTSGIMFIFAGSFGTMVKNETRKGIGFGSELEYNDSIQQSLHERVVKAGMRQELAGRISLISELNSLDRNDLRRAFDGVTDSIWSQYQLLQSTVEGIPKELAEEKIESILTACIKNGTGARGLQTELDKLLVSEPLYLNRFKVQQALGLSE